MVDSEDKMNWKSKVAIGAGVAAVLASLLYIVKLQNDILERNRMLEKSFVEQKQLADNITRAQSAYVTKKDLERFAKDSKIDLGPIKDDLKKLDAKVQGIQTIRVVTNGYVGNNLPSTGTTPNPNPDLVDPSNPDPFGYMKARQTLKLTEPFPDGKEVPFGEAGFSAWKKNPWDLTIKPREYGVVNVFGMDEDGRHYTYSKFSVTVDGKKQDIKITDTKFREELPQKKFRFYPRLFAGIDGGAYFTRVGGAAVPNLQIALFNYGATKPNPDWTFLGIGMGYEVVNNNFSFVLSPFYYNVGQHLPFVDNIHVRPTVMATATGDFAIMAGVGFGL